MARLIESSKGNVARWVPHKAFARECVLGQRAVRS